jgi:hypothetical protein
VLPRRPLLLLLAYTVLLAGCAPLIPKEALQLSPESLALRQLQTRRFETKDEKALLAAGAALLQDLGFTIDASATELGLIVVSKDRSAVEAGQVAASVFLGLLTALAGAPVIVPWDEKQKMRASLVTHPYGPNNENTLVRITFQRVVWNTQQKISKTEPLNDPKFYQEFFEKLSKAVFLHAHEF